MFKKSPACNSLGSVSCSGTYGNHHRTFCAFHKQSFFSCAVCTVPVLYLLWRLLRGSTDEIHAVRHRPFPPALFKRKNLLLFFHPDNHPFLSQNHQSHRLNHHQNRLAHRILPVQERALHFLFPVQECCCPVQAEEKALRGSV